MIMALKLSQRLFIRSLNHLNNTRYRALHSSPVLCSAEDSFDIYEPIPSVWYAKAYRKIQKLSCSLKNVDLIDGRLVNVVDDSTITDELLERKMRALKALVSVFIGSPSSQRRLRETMMAESSVANWHPRSCFQNSSEREPMVVDSLSKISDFFNLDSKQRQVVRFAVGPQVTQHHIWAGALDHVLKELKEELDPLAHQSPNDEGLQMGQQIVSSCLNFLEDSNNKSNDHSISWMRLEPPQPADDDLPASATWEEMLDMFIDLIRALSSENRLRRHVEKLKVMKEGLHHIKGVMSDRRSVGYKESKFQECLVRKKLTNGIGHASRCLFTLLLFYLLGQTRDIEVDVCGGVLKDVKHGSRKKIKRCRLVMGRVLSCDEERMVLSGMRQLHRAMGVFKFVWETAGLAASRLELQGHLWCVGAQERQISYKGNDYILHDITL